jgi:DNA-binding phage protein
MPKTAAKRATQTKTSPYDVAEHLRTPEEMAAYLARCMARRSTG